MIRRTPIKRSGPPRRKRPGTRCGEPSNEEKGVLRHFIYELSGGRCELNRPGCQTGVLPEDGPLGQRWELVHRRAKRRFGWPIDGEFRMLGGCHSCHSYVHQHGWE
jgi:hypothetical protein